MKLIKLIFRFWFFSCSLSFIASFPDSRNVDLEIGDSCKFDDGSMGTCRLDKDCPHFLDLIKTNQLNKIVKCGFVGIRQVVCCKEQKFSARFSKVICDGNLPKRPPKPITLDDHIIRGERADSGEFPHMAALGYEKEGSKTDYDFRCGGTLISENFVLTAAHCCNRKDSQPLMVRLGKTSLKDNSDMRQGQDIKIGKCMIHEKYSSRTKFNDIAIAKLDQPAELAYNVFPACVSSHIEELRTSNSTDFEEEAKSLTIIGFGNVETERNSLSGWLLKANVSSIPLSECKSLFESAKIPAVIEKTQICAWNTKIFSDTCQGDSGGPMSYSLNDRFYIYGITSYGLGCGAALPSIYTRVDEYLEWLDQKMNS